MHQEHRRTRVAEMMLFDTCTHKCAYCHLAESGKVLDNSQLRPYTDPAFIEKIAKFFVKRSSDVRWLITLTGGEPLLMPNLELFCSKVGAAGNKVAFYTAMLVGENHASFRYLIERGAEVTDYLMVSFHPEAELIEDKFFARLRRLRDAGHSVIFRFVGHPDRLGRLDELSSKCRDIDVAFHPTPMFSKSYPGEYTPEQRQQLMKHAVSYSQIVQMNNGLETLDLKCKAGSGIIAIDMRTGNISPCITVHHPRLGNIYDDEFNEMPDSILCPDAGVPCICDIHFQNDIIDGFGDSKNFQREKAGFVDPSSRKSLHANLDDLGLRFSAGQQLIGQTETPEFQALSKDTVKRAYEKNLPSLRTSYVVENHDEFLRRQIDSALGRNFPSLYKLKIKMMETVPGARRILK